MPLSALFEIELMKDLFPAALPGTLVSELKNKFYTNFDVLKKTLYEELIRKRYFLNNPETIRQKYVVIGFVMMFIGGFRFDVPRTLLRR